MSECTRAEKVDRRQHVRTNEEETELALTDKTKEGKTAKRMEELTMQQGFNEHRTFDND